jgi:hypothetical protein
VSYAATLLTVYDGQRAAFKRMPLAGNCRRCRNILEMGSLSCLPSTESITTF